MHSQLWHKGSEEISFGQHTVLQMDYWKFCHSWLGDNTTWLGYGTVKAWGIPVILCNSIPVYLEVWGMELTKELNPRWLRSSRHAWAANFWTAGNSDEWSGETAAKAGSQGGEETDQNSKTTGWGWHCRRLQSRDSESQEVWCKGFCFIRYRGWNMSVGSCYVRSLFLMVLPQTWLVVSYFIPGLFSFTPIHLRKLPVLQSSFIHTTSVLTTLNNRQ